MFNTATFELCQLAAVFLITALAAFAMGFVVGVFNERSYAVRPRRRNRRCRSTFESDNDTDVDDDLVLDHAPNWANSEKSDYEQGLRV